MPHQGPPIAVTTRPQPDAGPAAPSIRASDVESTIDQGGDFVNGGAPEPEEKKEEKRPAEKLAGRHRPKTLADIAKGRPKNSTPRERRPPNLEANHQRTTLR